MQYPTEVPGVALDAVMTEALAARRRDVDDVDGLLDAEAARHRVADGVAPPIAQRRPIGRREEAQRDTAARCPRPRIAVLDELDSGLDIDALRACSKRIEALTQAAARPGRRNGTTQCGHRPDPGVLAITHYSRLLTELHPDAVHILVKGRIVASGGPELADELEVDGYAAFSPDARAPTAHAGQRLDDLFRSTTSECPSAPECASVPQGLLRHSRAYARCHDRQALAGPSPRERCGAASSSPTSPRRSPS